MSKCIARVKYGNNNLTSLHVNFRCA